MEFKIEFSPDALKHLKSFEKHDQVSLLAAVERQLTHEPTKPTRKRKQMRSNLIATWELRVSNKRVYYDVTTAPDTVLIRAIGIKSHNQLTIGGQEIDLNQ
jgi:mRNA-degrading endonuclease RelE of RelBE toxin-antitoxin system